MKRNLLTIYFLLIAFAICAQSGLKNRKDVATRGADKSTLQIFPNPADNFIGVSANEEIKKIMVYNLVGREMKKFDAIKGKTYFVGDLPKGIYLVQLLGSKNKILRTQRVSKR